VAQDGPVLEEERGGSSKFKGDALAMLGLEPSVGIPVFGLGGWANFLAGVGESFWPMVLLDFSAAWRHCQPYISESS
jgi:hypothetical protein